MSGLWFYWYLISRNIIINLSHELVDDLHFRTDGHKAMHFPIFTQSNTVYTHTHTHTHIYMIMKVYYKVKCSERRDNRGHASMQHMIIKSVYIVFHLMLRKFQHPEVRIVLSVNRNETSFNFLYSTCQFL